MCDWRHGRRRRSLTVVNTDASLTPLSNGSLISAALISHICTSLLSWPVDCAELWEWLHLPSPRGATPSHSFVKFDLPSTPPGAHPNRDASGSKTSRCCNIPSAKLHTSEMAPQNQQRTSRGGATGIDHDTVLPVTTTDAIN